MKYRKRPVVVEAIQWDGRNWAEVIEFLGVPENGHGAVDDNFYQSRNEQRMDIIIHTPEGDMRAHLGDWIIKGLADEFYPCSDYVFRKTYELVDA